MIKSIHYQTVFGLALLIALSIGFIAPQQAQAQVTNPQQTSIGIEGVIPGEPPSQAPTISVPSSGQTFLKIPVTVSGICEAGLEVRIFKNGVFSGAVRCGSGGTYTIEIDLFTGRNDIVARQYDNLNQPGPDSSTVIVNYSSPGSEDGVEQLVLSSNFSSRGASPGNKLVWPLALAGGLGPYALSIDWGDGTVEPLSLESLGEFSLEHVYDEPGIYLLTVRATDSRGETAFIQLTAIANGPLDDGTEVSETGTTFTGDGSGDGTPPRIESTDRTFITWPMYFLMFFVFSTFWIGRRYERRRIKERLYNRQGF